MNYTIEREMVPCSRPHAVMMRPHFHLSASATVYEASVPLSKFLFIYLFIIDSFSNLTFKDYNFSLILVKINK